MEARCVLYEVQGALDIVHFHFSIQRVQYIKDQKKPNSVFLHFKRTDFLNNFSDPEEPKQTGSFSRPEITPVLSTAGKKNP